MPDQPQTLAPAKKAQKPLIVFLRLYDAERRRMEASCRRTGLGLNDIGLAGTLAEIARHEAAASPIEPAVAKLVTEAQREGIDVRACLKTAIKATLEQRALITAACSPCALTLPCRH